MAVHNDSTPNSIDSALSRAIKFNWETLVIIVILALAIFTRFHMVGDRVMSHDESLHTRYSYNLYNEGNFQHTPLMHGPVLFHMTALSYSLFGDNDFTSRIYTSLLGVAVVMSPLLFRRWLGRWGTILAMIMLLISPLMMYYNRYIRHDTPSILYALLMMWAIMMYTSGPESQRRRSHWLYLVAASMILNLGSKETAFIYIAIFGVFLAIYFFVRFAQYRWDLPGKTIFYLLMTGILLGGVLTLGMYIVFDIIQFDLISPTEVTRFGALNANDQATFLLWTGLAIASVVGFVIATVGWVYRDNLRQIRWGELALIFGLLFLTAFVLIVIEEVSHTGTGEEVEEAIRSWPLLVVWLITVVGFVFLFFTRRRDGDNKDKQGRGFWGTLDLFPEADLIIVIGTLILPWATAIIPYLMKGTAADYAAIAEVVPELLYNILINNVPQINTPEQVGLAVINVLAWLPLMALQIAIGLMWDWRRFIVIWLIFHAIFAFFFTTVFTNIAGLATGMVYSLGYWLEQQGVRRGGQPQYYYLLIIMPFYEFLPVIGGVLAMGSGMTFFWRWRRKNTEAIELENLLAEGEQDDQTDPASLALALERREASRLRAIPFLIFVSWLGVLNLVGYSLAGEKMPWLGTHLTLPLILLSAWFFGRVIERIDFNRFTRYGWVMLFVAPLFLITTLQVIIPLIVGRGPFRGLSQEQLNQTYSWLAVVVVSGVLAYVILRLSQLVGWRQIRQMLVVSLFAILAVMTFRSAWIASFINYDYPNEFLVYAHAAPAVKTVLDDIEEMSYRLTDSKNLDLVYDNSVSWPYSWYFRDYTSARFIGSNATVQNIGEAAVIVVGDDKRAAVDAIVEDRYQRFDYMRLWWPMQEYFYLTPQRVHNLFDFSPSNAQAGQLREGIFDIWWARDYTTYGNAIEKQFDLQRWPVSDTMHVYIRKDYAAQIWEYGTGDGTVENPLDSIEQNRCTTNWLTERQPELVIQPSEISLSRPLDLVITDDNLIYVAEESAHRVSVFTTDGEFVQTIGQQGMEPGMFNRPNAVALDLDGNLLVADTWNYRIQRFVDGESVLQFGQAGEFGFSATTSPVDGFWGPRDVAVDPRGRIYVSDTGNKRVRVYTLEAGEDVFLYDIASGGSMPGQLDEPSGLAIHDDGRIFVADTWNRRVSVFNSDGSFLTTIPVRGWYQELGNRPYLAIDSSRNLLYVTDPDVGRVLVYDTDGNCLGAFGSLAGDTPLDNQFRTVGGVAVDAEGYVYVADAALGRILKFAPGDDFIALNAAVDEAESDVSEPVELPEEVVDEPLQPMVPEVTAEASEETTSSE